jgi:membrane protease YdiL (CAAX protease family)
LTSPEPPAAADGADPLVPTVPPDATDPIPARPGAGTFTIEGRAAPALFVVGWLATLLGAGLIVIGLLSGGGTSAAIVLVVGLVLLSIGLVAGAGSQGIERRARARTAYLGPSPFLVFLASVPVSLLAIVLLALPMGVLGIAVDGPLGRLLSVLAQAVIYIALVRLLVVDVGALSWADMAIRRFDRRALVDLGNGALYAAPVIIVTLPIAAILGSLLPVQPESPLPATGTLDGLILNLLAGAIIAPIGEELLFRGFATTAWARDIGPRRALIRGALFFAVVHVLTISGGTAAQALGLAIVAFATRVPVALVLGWLFLRRNSIWASIGLHATFNGILLLLGELALRSGAV